jgi:hypothetical protein
MQLVTDVPAAEPIFNPANDKAPSLYRTFLSYSIWASSSLVQSCLRVILKFPPEKKSHVEIWNLPRKYICSYLYGYINNPNAP